MPTDPLRADQRTQLEQLHAELLAAASQHRINARTMKDARGPALAALAEEITQRADAISAALAACDRLAEIEQFLNQAADSDACVAVHSVVRQALALLWPTTGQEAAVTTTKRIRGRISEVEYDLFLLQVLAQSKLQREDAPAKRGKR